MALQFTLPMRRRTIGQTALQVAPRVMSQVTLGVTQQIAAGVTVGATPVEAFWIIFEVALETAA